MSFVFPTNASQVQAFAGALYGVQVGTTTMAQVNADIAANGGLAATLNSYYAASFGGATTASVATTVATNLGLTGDALTSGAAYVEAQLNAAAPGARGAVISSIVNLFAGLSADATFGAAATAWNAKVATAAAYTGTANVAVGTVVSSSVFTLTTGMDTFTGTAGNDTFNAALDGLLTTGDVMVGGAGTDTLISRHTITAATTIAPNATDVEILQVRLDHNGGAADAVTYSMVDVTGASEVQSYRSNNSGTTADAVLTFSGAGMNTGVTLAIVGGDSGADNSSVDITATYRSVTGTADSSNLRLDGAAANVVTIAGIETLNITATTGDKSVSTTGASTLNSLVAANATKVNINSAGTLTLSATDFAATVAIDASASTGAVRVSTEASTAVTFTGGAGADRVNIGAITELTAADALNGGEGTDTFATSATSLDATALGVLATELTNFERLEFTTTSTSAVSVDATDISVFNTLVFSAAVTGAAGAAAATGGGNAADLRTISGIENNDVIILSGSHVGGLGGTASAGVNTGHDGGNGGDAIVLTPELDNGSNTVSLTLQASTFTGGAGGVGAASASGGDAGDAINAANFETLNIVTAQNSAADLTTITIAAGAAGAAPTGGAAGTAGASVRVNTNGTINVSGDVAINLGTIAGTNASVNASALTKAITVVGEAGNNTLIGGAGKDNITGGLGYDVMTGGADADIFTIGLGATTTASDAQLASTGTTLNTSFEQITDYQKGVDFINLLASDDTALSESIVVNAGAVAGTAAIDSEGIATFASADDTLAEKIAAAVNGVVVGGTAAAGQFAVFEHAGNTYIYVSDGTDAVAVGDVLVQLTGVTGVTTTTINDSGYLILS